jgi:uncharacterized protein with HEPN domain
MPSERRARAFADILEYAEPARSFVDGMTPEAFTADRRTVLAVTRCLEIISEAARRLDDAARDRHPDLPWKAIMGAGNVYRHDYDNVAEVFLWRTVQERLPELIAAARAELDG